MSCKLYMYYASKRHFLYIHFAGFFLRFLFQKFIAAACLNLRPTPYLLWVLGHLFQRPGAGLHIISVQILLISGRI